MLNFTLGLSDNPPKPAASSHNKMVQHAPPNRNKEHFTWPCLLGFYWELLLDVKKGKPYECGICGLLARQVVEMICREHSNHENSDSGESEEDISSPIKVYCLVCLTGYLKTHDNRCPIGNHKNPKYQHAATIERGISRLKVKCPRALRHQQKLSDVRSLLPSPRPRQHKTPTHKHTQKNHQQTNMSMDRQAAWYRREFSSPSPALLECSAHSTVYVSNPSLLLTTTHNRPISSNASLRHPHVNTMSC